MVFCFHGGGGKAYFAVDEYAIHKNWPEALVYYAQGLAGSGGYSSWSRRDVAFFDAMRSDAVHHRNADPARVFVMGYSTGANFCGDLWGLRGSQIAGFAFVSGGRYAKSWPPRPVYLSYGQEPDGPRLKALGNLLSAVAAKAHMAFILHPRSTGHTYPQDEDVAIANFLKTSAAKRL